MQELPRFEDVLSELMPAAMDLLRDMVQVNSYTANPAGVNRLGELTASAFAPMGFSAEFIPSSNPAWGKHLVLTRRGSSGKALALISHLDTVFPPEEEVRNNFHWQREGDRIYGPGTHDIKGGTVMMWLVLSALQRCAPNQFGQVTWQLCFNSSEETLSYDFGNVCRARLTGETLAALVFEAEGRSGAERLVVTARKGRVTWRITVAGRGAHAGGKHAHGANAIVELAAVIQRVAGLTDYERQLTFNVAVVSGGTVLNRVPHTAQAEGEFRAFDPEVLARAKSELLGLAGPGQLASAADGFRSQVQVQILSESRGWRVNPDTERLARTWQETGGELGMDVGFEQRGGLSDGNLLWDFVPTLDGLGPWGDNDHCSERTPDGSKLPEFVDVTSFVPKAMLNAAAIMKLIGGIEGEAGR